MVARADVEEFRQANAALSTLVRSELSSLFGSLDLNRPEAARDLLLEVVPGLTERYGRDAAGLAAEWYEEQRAASGTAGAFRARMAPALEAAAVQSQVRYQAGHLWTPRPQAMLQPLLTAVDKFVKQPARDTMRSNAKREGVSWARIPSGSKTCSFCLMLASRDAVYATKRSAGRRADGDKYHGDCDCVVVRIKSPADYPDGFDSEEMYRMYEVARDEAGSGDLKDIAAAMRRTFPDVVRDGVHTP